MAALPPAVTFFAEDRLFTDSSGRPVALDASFAVSGWARGAQDLTSCRLVARLSPGSAESAYPVNGEVSALPYYEGGRGLVVAAPRLLRAVWREVGRSSVVAVRLPGMVGLLAVLAATMRRRPLLIEVVGDINDVLASGVGGGLGALLRGLARRVTAAAVRRGRWVRFVTEQQLQTRYPARSSADSYVFSDVVLCDSDFETPREEREDVPTIVAVGSQEQYYKGHDLLIRAVAQLGDEFPTLWLRLLGDGRVQPALRSLAAELGVDDRVAFLGHVSPREAVTAELDRAWIFAMPSRTEGMPRALIEAMAIGLPCVGSRVGGIPELLPEEMLFRSGDLNGLRDVLRRLLKDPALRASAGSRNRWEAQRLRDKWRGEEARWRALLNELTAESGAR